MARTTLDLDRAVLEELRERARAEGKSMGELGSELLAVQLKRTAADPAGRGEDFSMPSFAMGEPLVDIDDKDALYAVQDERG